MVFAGLEVSPITLMKTMMPHISPEVVTDAAVKVFGGYDPSLFAVSINSSRINFSLDLPTSDLLDLAHLQLNKRAMAL